jgi:hypothetical protein
MNSPLIWIEAKIQKSLSRRQLDPLQVIRVTSNKEKIALLSVGLTLIVSGLFFNETVLSILFSSGGTLELSTRIKILLLNLFFVITGLFLAYNRNNFIIFENLYKSLLKIYPKTVSMMIGVIFSIMTLVILDLCFFAILTYKKTPIIVKRSKNLYDADANLGYKPKNSIHVSSKKMFKNGKIIYDVEYSIDENSRRITPFDLSKKRDSFILFFGCSFTFGEGVNDHETMPFYVSQYASNYTPYNYGFSGYGPQAMLAKLQSEEITKEISERQGILIYTFINNHINRAIGDMIVHNTWGHNMPYYATDRDGNIFRKGSFTSGRPVLSLLYGLLSKSNIVQYSQLNFPTKISENHVRFFIKIFEESREIFYKKFNSDKFYVVLYPSKILHEKVIPLLKEKHFKYLNYTNLLNIEEEKFHISGDGHPTKSAHKIVAFKIAEDIGILDLLDSTK